MGLTPTISTLHIKQLCSFLHITSTAITVLMKLSIAIYHVLISRKLQILTPIQKAFVHKKVNEEECEEMITGVSG